VKKLVLFFSLFLLSSCTVPERPTFNEDGQVISVSKSFNADYKYKVSVYVTFGRSSHVTEVYTNKECKVDTPYRECV
jgi:hypothetical protein